MSGSLILAALLWPGLFYAGVGAVSVPILIHLLSKRRFRRVRWAAVEFLLEAERRNRRRMRIEELILLALRCLVILLVGLTLARWFMRPEALMAMLGSTGRSQRIIVLDDSFSTALRMSAGQAAGDSVFDRSKGAVERLVHWLRDESPGDRLSILLTSRPETPWRSETRLEDLALSDFNANLAALKPSHRGGNLTAAFSAVRSILDAQTDNLNATVYVLSDFQRTDWGSHSHDEPSSAEAAGATKLAASPAAALAGWVGGNRGLRLVLVDAGVSEARNLAVTSLEPLQATAVAGLSGQYTAKIANFGPNRSEPGSLQVFVGDAAQPPAAVPAIDPWQTVEVAFEVTFPNEGPETLTVELSADPLMTDNTRWLAVPVSRAVRILVVNGESSPDPYQDEAFLLRVALRPEGPQFSGNDVTVIDDNELEQTDLMAFQAVIFANVYRINEEVASRIEQYAEAGGGVIFFLGDQVDADLYNRILYRDGQGALPALLGEVISAPEDRGGTGLGEINATHPAMRRFGEAGVAYFAGVVASHYMATQTDPLSEPASGPAGSPQSRPSGNAPPDRSPTQVLMRFEDAEKTPAVLTRPFGLGKVVLVTTSVDKEWNNFADRPMYLVLLMELIQYVARHAATTHDQLVCEPIRLPIDTTRHLPHATLKTARYPEEPAVRIDARSSPDYPQPHIEWAQTDQPGVYRFELTETTGGQAAEQVSVNVDPRESDLRQVDRATLLRSFGDLPVEYVNAEQLGGDSAATARRELWPMILALVVLALMAEQGLAWWFGNEGRWRR